MSTYCRPAQEHLFISSQGYLSPCCFIKDAKDRLPDIEDLIDWFYNDNAQKNLRDTLIDLHNYAAMAIMLLDEK